MGAGPAGPGPMATPGATREVAFVALGSNLPGPRGSPREAVLAALAALDDLPGTRRVARSRLYHTQPLGGPAGQPDYVNAVARLETTLPPKSLLEALQGLEAAWGRQRVERWGPRTLDLDLLVHGARRLDREGLCLPHPRLAERDFVILPLLELAPDLEVPGLGPLARLAEGCPMRGAEPLPEASW